jgi:hypothetical protein
VGEFEYNIASSLIFLLNKIINKMEQPVRIFKCPCEGNKFKLAGKPNDKPTLKEKREYGEYIAVGCTVVTIPVKQFREENWEWCPKHF